MERRLPENLREKLYGADSCAAFLAALPYPAALFSRDLAPLYMPPAFRGFSLSACTPYSAAEPPFSFYPLPNGLFGLDLCKDGVYAGSLVLRAPAAIADKAAEELGRAILLAMEIFDCGATPDVDMDCFLAEMQEAPGPLFCLYCAVDPASRAAGRLRAALREELAPLHLCYTGAGLAALFSNGNAANKTLPEAVENLLREAGCIAGIAGPFAKPVLALGCAQKAMRASAFCKTGGRPRPFAPLRWRIFCAEACAALEAEGLSPMDFLHEGLVRMLDCDTQNDTGYFESLYAYLSHGKSLRCAAEALGVHRNTLDYRIHRIQEIFNLDLENPNLCFELLFSCRLYLSCTQGNNKHKAFPTDGLLDCLRDTALPPSLRERALAALCRREEAMLCRALHAGEAMLATLPDTLYPLQCIYADLSECAEEDRPALFASLRACYPHTALACDENSLLMGFHCPPEKRGEQLAVCAEILARANCRGAASQAICKGSLSTQLRLCRLAYEAGRQINMKEPLHRFEDYASTALFMAVEGHMQLSLFYADEMMRVMEYDYEHGTTLSRSFHGYLSCFLDLKQAAVQTGLHRNTLSYHIRKIMQMLGKERADSDFVFENLCSYRMLSTLDALC